MIKKALINVILLSCPCGTQHPAFPNASEGVEREERCDRCLSAEIAALKRTIDELRRHECPKTEPITEGCNHVWRYSYALDTLMCQCGMTKTRREIMLQEKPE